MWRPHGVLITALLAILSLGCRKLMAADIIPVFPVMDYCGATIDLDQSEIGLLKWDPALSSSNGTQHTCNIALQSPQERYIGVQILELQQSAFCVPRVHIAKTYCVYNITLREEISSKHSASESILQLSFYWSSPNVNDEDIKVPGKVSVLFYMYSESKQSPFVPVCLHNYKKCAQSSRCLPESAVKFASTYNICQTQIPTDNNIGSSDTTDIDEDDGANTGLSAAITIGMLVILISVLIGINYFSRRNCCGLRFGTASVVVNGRRSTSSSGVNRHRPVFSLSENDAPPPNYSDLSFHGEGTNSAATSSDSSVASSSASTEVTQDSTVTQMTRKFRISTESSLGRVSNTLPPTYSDAVVNEDKYHVHTL